MGQAKATIHCDGAEGIILCASVPDATLATVAAAITEQCAGVEANAQPALHQIALQGVDGTTLASKEGELRQLLTQQGISCPPRQI